MNKTIKTIQKLCLIMFAAISLSGCMSRYGYSGYDGYGGYGSYGNGYDTGFGQPYSYGSGYNYADSAALIGHTFEYQYDDPSYTAETTFYNYYLIDEVYRNGRPYSSERAEVTWQGSDFTCAFEDGNVIRYYYTDDPQQAYSDQYYYYYDGRILIWGTEEYTQVR